MTNCPRDGCALSEARIVRIMGEVCPYCNGTWLPAGALATLQKAATDLPPEEGLLHAEDPHGIKCPHCGVVMKTRWFSDKRGVLLDVCPQCEGIWLDTAELRGIVEEGRSRTL